MKLNQRLAVLAMGLGLVYFAVPRPSGPAVAHVVAPHAAGGTALSKDTERKLLSALHSSEERLLQVNSLIDTYSKEAKERRQLADSVAAIESMPAAASRVQRDGNERNVQRLPDHPAGAKPPPPPPGKTKHPTRPPESPAIGNLTGEVTVAPLNLETMDPIAVLVIACNRVTVSVILEKLIRYRPSASKFPIIVSQDCMDDETANVIRAYADRGVELYQQPNQTDPMPKSATKKERKWSGYFKIARHYKFALTTVFAHEKKFDSVIIVEDDLDIAPDFFEYFTVGRQLLKADPTLYCVSAWNDNGKGNHVADPAKLYRTDFFGGLGWMIVRELWDDELADKWTNKYWDDWFRLPDQRKGRSCIRPEIGRSSMAVSGKKGVSKGQFYKKYLQFIRLNDKKINFTQADVSYLLKQNYDQAFLNEVYALEEISQLQLQSYTSLDTSKSYRIEYVDNAQFRRIAKFLKIMEDLKEGVPRTAYLGVVSLSYRATADSPPSTGVRIHIAPARPWAGYVEYFGK